MGGLEAIMKASVELVSGLPMSRAIDCKRGEQDRADLGIDTEVAERLPGILQMLSLSLM